MIMKSLILAFMASMPAVNGQVSVSTQAQPLGLESTRLGMSPHRGDSAVSTVRPRNLDFLPLKSDSVEAGTKSRFPTAAKIGLVLVGIVVLGLVLVGIVVLGYLIYGYWIPDIWVFVWLGS